MKIHANVLLFLSAGRNGYLFGNDIAIQERSREGMQMERTIHPLNLTDIRHEQRRVAALLNMHDAKVPVSHYSKHGPKWGVFRRRNDPEKRYRILGGISEDATLQNQSLSSMSEDNYGRKYFSTKKNNHKRKTGKLSASYPSANSSLYRGSDTDTTLDFEAVDDVREGSRNGKLLKFPSLQESNKVVKRAPRVTGREEAKGQFTVRVPDEKDDISPNLPPIVQDANGKYKLLDSADAYGHFRYHHRIDGDNNTLPQSFSKDSVSSLFGSQSREMSFVFNRNDTTSSEGYRREGTNFTSDSGLVITRMKTNSWCECPKDISIIKEQCQECSMKNGHHDAWCTFFSRSRSHSKIIYCPNCGKPIRREKTNESMGSFHRKSGKSNSSKKLGSDSGIVISREPSDYDMIRESLWYNRYGLEVSPPCSANTDDLNSYLRRTRSDFVEDGVDEADSESVTQRLDDTSKRVDPQVHRNAYIAAMADRRAYQIRKNGQMYANQLTRPFVFSYFQHVPAPCPDCGKPEGAKPPKTKKQKALSGLKNILGDIKIDDYYPRGRKYKSTKSIINRQQGILSTD